MKKPICYIFLLLLLSGSSYARWATRSDAVTRLTADIKINVNSDGSFEQIAETAAGVLTELARDAASHLKLRYTSDSEEIEILEAKTIFEDKQYVLGKNLIEDKPLASVHKGFDQINQILLAFPKVEVGSVLFLKYKRLKKKPELDNFFAQTFYFGRGGLEEKSRVKIVSKLPLYVLTNDPDHVLEIKKLMDKASGTHTVEISLIKPQIKIPVNEPEDSIVSNKHLTWVSVSTLNNWKEFAISQTKPFDEVIAQKLPDKFAAILKKAREKNSAVEKIDTVTSMLNEKVRYLGDWRSIKGRFAPRNLETISETGLADCKDFSAVTAAILNKAGFKAQIALVKRGTDEQSANTLPDFAAFNHAMVKATAKDGKIYWIDPTNFASMAGRIFPDIAGKIALVLDPKQPTHEKIPPVDPNSAKVTIIREWEILANGNIVEKGSQKMENEEALELTGASLMVSADIIKEALFNGLARKNLESKFKKNLELPKLNSRIVEDISFTYSFERENEILKTNVGPALILNSGIPIKQIYNLSQDHVSDFLLYEFASSIKRQTIIKNIKVQNIASLNKEIDSPWLYFKRECRLDKDGNLQIDDMFIMRKHLIPNEDLKNPDFIKLREWIVENLKDTVIVFEKK